MRKSWQLKVKVKLLLRWVITKKKFSKKKTIGKEINVIKYISILSLSLFLSFISENKNEKWKLEFELSLKNVWKHITPPQIFPQFKTSFEKHISRIFT